MIGDPKVIVNCDTPGCQWEEEYSLTVTVRGWDDRGLESQVRREGWTVEDGGNTTYCPDCTKARKEEAAAT